MPKDGVRSPEAGINRGLPDAGTGELNPGLLRKLRALLTTELSLQPLPLVLFLTPNHPAAQDDLELCLGPPSTGITGVRPPRQQTDCLADITI